MTASARIAGDRLYSLAFRPQELALFGSRVAIDFRYAPIADPGAPPATTHWRVAVLEILTQVPAAELGGAPEEPPRELSLLKIGWEVELATPTPLAPERVDLAPGEAALVVGRIADTVNDLARRAGIAPAIDDDLIAELVRSCVLSPPTA